MVPDNYYRAESATLWQLGVGLFGIPHRYPPIRSCDLSFSESRFRTHSETHTEHSIWIDCNYFVWPECKDYEPLLVDMIVSYDDMTT